MQHSPSVKLGSKLSLFSFALLWLLIAPMQSAAQSPAPPVPATGSAAAELKTARYFDSIKTQPLDVYAFLREMPKGADLHLHLSGSIYAESFIEWAAKAKPDVCVDPNTFALSFCSGNSTQIPASRALTDGVLYRKMLYAWSMLNLENSGLSGHDQFFDAFAKFGPASDTARFADMVAEVAKRSATERVSYLEIMLTPDNGKSREAGRALIWKSDEELAALSTAELNAYFAQKRDALLAGGIVQPISSGTTSAIQETKAVMDKLETQLRDLLRCADPSKASPACQLQIRYVYQVARSLAPREAFAQMVGAMEIMKAEPRVVALNMVQAEDTRASMNNFPLQMKMLDYLNTVTEYKTGNVTLHAGELAPGLVPPEGLRFHIRDSVQLGHAKRIGHGVDVMYEDKPYELLKEMAAKNVLVEVCLTSNDGILGVRGKEHPLSAYLKAGVPVALATDDLGISRSEMTQEYAKAVKDHGLDYRQLKRMARNSLEYSFVGGASFWKDSQRFVPVAVCQSSLQSANPSAACQSYLGSNARAKLQFELEQAFIQFEKNCCGNFGK
ncbi:MAG TPA: adenosine deaminase [Blastocatellia bacterium]|nr:adenosine deaminase [Blastocatellia bacterium]